MMQLTARLYALHPEVGHLHAVAAEASGPDRKNLASGDGGTRREPPRSW